MNTIHILHYKTQEENAFPLDNVNTSVNSLQTTIKHEKLLGLGPPGSASEVNTLWLSLARL